MSHVGIDHRRRRSAHKQKCRTGERAQSSVALDFDDGSGTTAKYEVSKIRVSDPIRQAHETAYRKTRSN
jgi:hypothetical protein